MRSGAADVDYDHSRNLHTVAGARAALTLLLGTRPAGSLLDVGCGRGTWLRAALDLGIAEICGIDGAAIPDDAFLFPRQFFRSQNLCEAWDLGRRFDTAICLEVAEHLPAEAASQLVGSLVKHADVIFFSAAAPGQAGQHHVNCRWPEYWQTMFNMHGYACSDSFRWMIWDMEDIEPWYRQNLFQATYSPDTAGKEARIRAVIHPQMLDGRVAGAKADCISRIERGAEPAFWYVALLSKSVSAKLMRKLGVAK